MKISELMEGVMQTGDPGMGTPEANKAGWGSGNYVSQRSNTAENSKKKKSNKDKKIKEAATAGATSSGSIATVSAPQLSPGPARGKKSYTGTPGKSGTKAPPQPKPKQQSPKDNALDMKGVSLFGQPIKR